jgi:3-oxoacyl-[acyl-carrier protein] reductase
LAVRYWLFANGEQRIAKSEKFTSHRRLRITFRRPESTAAKDTMHTLEGHVALVTGAGAGIGRAIALELATRGASVALHYFRSRQGAEETADAIRSQGRGAMVVGGDLTHAALVREVVHKAADALGPINVLVNNAGDLVERRKLTEMSEDTWRKVFDLNVTSAFFCAQAVAPSMIEQRRGAIVNVSSLAAHNGGGQGAFAYAAAKAAVIGFTKGIAKELAPHGIRVNAVAPGLIGNTPFHARFTADEAFKAAERGIPLGRAGTPEDVALAVAFLASPEAAFLVGETLEINGGAWFR